MTKLDELIKTITKKHIYVQTHNYPDQDALASAMGLKELLKYKGIDSTICYKGQIDKFNTIKMVELLDIEVIPIDNIHMEIDDEIIIVDGQKGNVNVEDFVGNEIGCIDHHEIQDISLYRFYDIQSDIGACSSIIANYFIENDVPISVSLATALVYGIKVDTCNLSRSVSNLDVDMFCLLFKMADPIILRKFDNCSLQMTDLTAYLEAFSDLRVYNGIGVANIGKDCAEAIIGTVSDFLLSLKEIQFTLVYSYRAGGLKISARSEDFSIDASEVIKVAIQGLGGGGGGHAVMAAGFVPNIKSDYEAKNMARLIEQRAIEYVTSKKKSLEA